MNCGMYEIVITPPLGSSIPGYYEERFASGIKDELYAKALVLESAGKTVVFVAVDTFDLTREVVCQIRDRIHAFTRIDTACIMVAATHTHTGGHISPWFSGKVDEEYAAYLIKKAADSAILAFRGRRKAKLGYGKGKEAGIAFQRRFVMSDGKVVTNPGVGNPDIAYAAGPVDPEVSVIRIDDEFGDPIGVVCNFACHTDVVSGTEYSGDYPGALSHMVKQALGDSVISLFLMGASGNINHHDVSGELQVLLDHHKRMGTILAGELIRVRERIETSEQIDVVELHDCFETGLREPSAEERLWAMELLQSQQRDISEVVMANEIVKLQQEKENGKTAEIEMQVFRIGEMAIVALPAEIFVEYGLQIKAQSPFPFTMVCELANGSGHGYVCIPEAYEQGGYEPRITSMSRLGMDTGSLFAASALKLLGQLHDTMRE